MESQTSPGRSSSPNKLTDLVGTWPYMSPEVENRLLYNHKTDIFSLGMIILSMIFGDLNLDLNLEKNEKIRKIVNDAHKGIVNVKLVTKKLRLLVVKMLNIEPNNRPDFQDIFKELKSIIETVKNEISFLQSNPGVIGQDSVESLGSIEGIVSENSLG